jgi:hypothetical protein
MGGHAGLARSLWLVLTVTHFADYPEWREQMRNSKHGLKALGLAVMATVLGTMAFATAAQAQHAHELSLHELSLLATDHTLHLLVLADETNPNPLSAPGTAGSFLVNLATALLATITGEQLGKGYLLVASRDLKIECGELEINSGKISNTTDGAAEVTFKKCVANNHKGEPLKDCLFKELETIKASALVLPISHAGQSYVLFEPLTGTEFANVKFKPETTCTLPLNNPVTGSVVAKVDALDAVTQTILFNEAVQLLNGDVLKYGVLANTAYVNGHVDLKLSGAHTGQKLGVH